MPGCKYNKNGETNNDSYVYQNLANIAQGIFLNIDNNMLTACQRAADTAMIKVCGSTENCNELVVNNGLGSRSLEYKICEYTGETDNMNINYSQCRPSIDSITDDELGKNTTTTSSTNSSGNITYKTHTPKPFAAVIDGTIYWDSVEIDEKGNIDVSNYFTKVERSAVPKTQQGHNGGSMSVHSQINTEQKQRITDEIAALRTSIETAINAIESDQTVQYCMEGRDNGWRYTKDKAVQGTGKDDKARFPNLTKQMRNIITSSALAATKENYYARYDELNEKMLQDYAKIAERKTSITKENQKDQRRNIARESCLYLADMSSLARSAEPPKNAFGNTMLWFFVGPVALVGVLTNVGQDSANGSSAGFIKKDDAPLVASKETGTWNYKETITTTFDWENLICHKCVRSTQCDTTRNPIFGNKYCETWGEETETCTDTQF